MTLAEILTRVLIVAAVCAGVYLGWSHYEGLVADKARLTKEVAQVTQVNTENLAELANVRLRATWIDATLVARTDERNNLMKERKARDAERDALHNRPDVKPWADTALPGPIVERLRRGPSGADARKDGVGGAAKVPDAANAGAGVQR